LKMVREVPKKWTHRVHTVIHGDSVGTIFWVASPLKGEPINTYHWNETVAANPRFSVIYFRSVVFFLLGSLIIIPCARTNVPKIEEIRRGSAVCAAVALHWCERGVHCTNSHQVYVLDRSPSSFVVGFKAWFALWKLVSLCKSNLPS
jgi:hypothetical protein